MCGISGYIGNSKDPELSYLISSRLFERIETRGKDAAGFWASNKENNIIYHKEPIRSSLFVKNSYWKKSKLFNPNILLCHAREASSGVGVPLINNNNHPFVNYDKKIALMHNGRIPDSVYEYLINYYDVNSDCDSEILLRVFENADTDLNAIKNIWSFAQTAYMAVAIGRNTDSIQKLYLFRNEYRPLCTIDLQDILGQIYFCSTPEIWENTLLDKKLKHILKKRMKLITLPPKELWVYELNDVIYTERYGIEIGNNKEPISHPKIPLKPSVVPLGSICGLNSKEELLNAAKPKEEVYGCIKIK